jgi:hypothetical protein
MSQEIKRNSLLFLVLALISLVLLSGALSNLELHAGQPFPGADPNHTSQRAVAQLQTYSFTALPGILGLILSLLIIYVLVSLTAVISLKWLLPWLLKFILGLTVLFVFLIILCYLNIGSTGASEWILDIVPSTSSGISTSPLGQPPKEFIWFAGISFALACGLLILKIFRKQLQPSHSEDLLLQQAKNAMQALQSGDDFKNVIIHCYLQMTNTLKEERGIERSHEMTAREFQDWLEFKGLPHIPVQNLTNLFEKVRYGQQHLGENDQKIALDSLREIIQFAERTKDEVSAE